MRVIIIFKVLLLIRVTWMSSAIEDLEPFNNGPYKAKLPIQDPCNPLYWYPRQIPNYCHNRSTLKPIHMPPLPILIPPPPMPFLPGFMPPGIPPPVLPILPPPLPYGIPLEPTHPMLPVAQIPYASPMLPYNPQNQIGFLPGIPGIVSDDAGINILPFSDAYADMLEKHKRKMIRRRYEKILNDYDDYPWKLRRHKFF